MKALITGGRGFIGSFLVEEWLRRGGQARCLLRNKGKNLVWLKALDFEQVTGDVTEPELLTLAVQGVDYVFHLAGLTKSQNKAEFYKINVEGTKNLLEAISKSNPGLKRFVLISSLAAVGPSPEGKLLNELDFANPISHYGRSKLKAEEITLQFSQKFPISIVRPPVVYGPRDRDMFELFKYAKRGWLPVFSGGTRHSSAIYVKDLVDGILLVAEQNKSKGQIYFLADDEPYSWDDFGYVIAGVCEVKPRKIKIPLSLAFLLSCGFELTGKITNRPALFNLDKFRELKATNWTCDNSKAKKELGFRIHFGLKKGVSETAQWYLENGWL